MRIAIISQFYPPEPVAAANRVAAMASAFAAGGDEVHIYTGFPSFPDGAIAPAYRGLRHALERPEPRIVVERVWTSARGAHAPGNRILNWLSVAAGISAAIAAQRERFDAVLVSSPPITLALPAFAGAFAHRAPLFCDVRDVWPEIAIAMRSWAADGVQAQAVRAIADRLYARSALVSCVTETAREQIRARGVAPAKIWLASNGFDAVTPAAEAPYPPLPGVRDVVYLGNMGLATGLDVVLDAAALLRTDSALRFVMIGGGADAQRLRARAEREGLANVAFTGPLPRADALRALADAALTVVPLVATIADSIPTKLFDAMAVGTPIVLSAGGEAQRLVERSGAGVCAAPGDPGALAGAIRRVLDDDELRAQLARRGPPFVRENYDRAAVMARLAERVRAAISR